MILAIDRRQEAIDAFYAKTGPCCAGCDWWAHMNSVAGECRKSAPVPAEHRFGMARMDRASWHSHEPDAGHIVTNRDHHCGDFKDEFDWSTLAPSYLRRIGRADTGKESSDV
jgi:hypothetical protein